MNAENSPEAKQANRDIIHFGLADLGYLLSEVSPQDLGLEAIARHCRSFDRAMRVLSGDVGPGELAFVPSEDMKTYASLKNAYGFSSISKARHAVEAGEELMFNPARSIRKPIRRFNRSHLPDEECYLPFSSKDQNWLLLSADEIAVAHYEDKAELFIPDLGVVRQSA